MQTNEDEQCWDQQKFAARLCGHAIIKSRRMRAYKHSCLVQNFQRLRETSMKSLELMLQADKAPKDLAGGAALTNAFAAAEILHECASLTKETKFLASQKRLL